MENQATTKRSDVAAHTSFLFKAEPNRSSQNTAEPNFCPSETSKGSAILRGQRRRGRTVRGVKAPLHSGLYTLVILIFSCSTSILTYSHIITPHHATGGYLGRSYPEGGPKKSSLGGPFRHLKFGKNGLMVVGGNVVVCSTIADKLCFRGFVLQW